MSQPANLPWSDWLPEGSFHFSTKDVPYVDRASGALIG